MNAPPSLRELQEWMRWAITDPRGLSHALLEPHPEDRGARYQAPAVSALEAVDGDDRASRERRLDVYAEGYFARILESVASDFPATRAALGEDDFRILINDYLKVFPSRYPNIGEIGRDLPRFLLQHPASVELAPAAPELAALEWKMVESFHAAKAPPFDPASLAAVPEDAWSGARFVFEPGVSIESSAFQLKALIDETDPDAAHKPEPTDLLVYRRNGFVNLETLAPMEARVLRQLKSGATLEAAMADVTEAESLISEWFSRWLAMGLVTEILFPGGQT